MGISCGRAEQSEMQIGKSKMGSGEKEDEGEDVTVQLMNKLA